MRKVPFIYFPKMGFLTIVLCFFWLKFTIHGKARMFIIEENVVIANRSSSIDVAKVIQDKYKTSFISLTLHFDENTLFKVLLHRPFGYLVESFQEHFVKLALSNIKKQELKFNVPSLKEVLSVWGNLIF